LSAAYDLISVYPIKYDRIKKLPIANTTEYSDIYIPPYDFDLKISQSAEISSDKNYTFRQ